MNSVLYTTYKNDVVPALKNEKGYKNIMQVPRIEKITVNVGYGRHTKDKAYKDRVEQTLSLITGQHPVRNKARKSISNFKIREGMEIGSSVTLRGKAMYEFLYKFINLTLPRVRDFRGLNPKSFDGAGNYALGFKEQLAFPEISGDAADVIHPLQVIITTSATTDDDAYTLLDKLGFPFKK